ncbi:MULTISPECIES: pentapeptide repeat-containing protein [unclassified Streptomyces]|uniref:pentapeptide repeat-containing protein n=1 Tax=unclassified Streptomyces TaxID=2593676 RepID=UPI0038683CD0
MRSGGARILGTRGAAVEDQWGFDGMPRRHRRGSEVTGCATAAGGQPAAGRGTRRCGAGHRAWQRTNTNLTRAQLNDADLTGAHLNDANLNEGGLTGAAPACAART